MSSNKPLKSVLINPLVSRDINEPHRAATALELFYDLIYVIAIASLAAELHHALSGWHHGKGDALIFQCNLVYPGHENTPFDQFVEPPCQQIAHLL